MPKPPTFDPPASLRSGVPEVDRQAMDEEIVQALEGYRVEADNNRKSGLNPRDDKWRENLDLYWNRADFSQKAKWQAKETMPEVSQYVDRFAAAMKEALVSTDFYTVRDPADQESDLTSSIKRMTDVWLTRCGRNQMGQLMPFSAVFEEQMKLGAIVACCSVTTWKEDVQGGRVAVETVDPRFVWLDHTNRNLYRMRRIEIDKHDLVRMTGAKDTAGSPIFNLENIERMVGSMMEDQRQKEEMTGTGQQVVSSRQPVVLDEYLATVIGKQGQVLADRSLMVVANGRYLVRGPEKNPFWHDSDWLTFAPLVTTPLSVYGRSYMEDFGSVARTFTELTNMILDAVHTSSMKVWALVPGLLLNPEQATSGIKPNKMFLLEDGVNPEQFFKSLDMGTLSPDSFRMWQEMKRELSEAAGINEIGLGQFAPKGRTSATEIVETKQSSSALIRSVAQTVEMRYLDPTLDLVWKTGLQHVAADNPLVAAAAGQEMFQALIKHRRDLIARPITFQARGISSLIANAEKLKALVAVLQLMGSSPVMLQEFLRIVDMSRFVKMIFELSNIDVAKLQATDRERMIRQLTEPMQQAQQPTSGGGQGGSNNGGGQAVSGLLKSIGIG